MPTSYSRICSWHLQTWISNSNPTWLQTWVCWGVTEKPESISHLRSASHFYKALDYVYKFTFWNYCEASRDPTAYRWNFWICSLGLDPKWISWTLLLENKLLWSNNRSKWDLTTKSAKTSLKRTTRRKREIEDHARTSGWTKEHSHTIQVIFKSEVIQRASQGLKAKHRWGHKPRWALEPASIRQLGETQYLAWRCYGKATLCKHDSFS